MRRKITMLFVALLACMGVVKAEVNAELQNKEIEIGTAVTEVTDGWYILNNVGRGNYVSEETTAMKMRATSSVVNGNAASEKAGYLFKITEVSDGKYNIQSGNGLYFSLGWNSSAISASPVEYEIIRLIGNSTDNFCLYDVANKYAADGQETDNGFVGWSSTIPASAGGNDSYRLLPVTLKEASFVELVYNFVYEGNVKYTQKEMLLQGTAYPDYNVTLPYAVTAEAKPTGVVNENTTVNVALTVSGLPFSVSTLTNGKFGDGMKWYNLKLREKDVTYDAGSGKALAQNVEEKGIYNLFAFTGNPFDGYSIYNYAAGSNKIFWRENAQDGGRIFFTNIEDTDGKTWVLGANGESGYTFRLNGHNTAYINDHNNDIAIWNSSWAATDGGSMFQFVFVENPSLTVLCDVTYNYVYENDVKFTKTVTVEAGAEYPTCDYQTPYGVAVVGAKPEGTVEATGTHEIALAVNKGLPFEAAESAEDITTWYYLQMHTNQPGYIGDIADDCSINVAKDKESDESDNYVWGFVGNVFDGITVVNKETGSQLTSTGNGNVTLTNAGTVFFVAATTETSENATYGFCLRNSNSTNYVNANYTAGKLSHWGSTDAGSTFFATECDKEYAVEVSSVGYSTYYSLYRLAIPETVKAYVVAETKDGSAVLKQVTGVLPARTGVILEGEGAHTFVTTDATAAAIESNKLQGSIAAKEVTVAENKIAYILGKGTNDVGLYKVKLNDGKFTNGANKAYMILDVEAAAGAAMFSFGRGEGTTGIDNSQLTIDNVVIYDLTGRRVETMEKGIYIVNGKKVIR